MISNVHVDQADVAANRYVTTASFVLLEYRVGWEQRLFGGQLQHTLRRARYRFEIVLKRVNLINCDARFPALAVPF